MKMIEGAKRVKVRGSRFKGPLALFPNYLANSEKIQTITKSDNECEVDRMGDGRLLGARSDWATVFQAQ